MAKRKAPRRKTPKSSILERRAPKRGLASRVSGPIEWLLGRIVDQRAFLLAAASFLGLAIAFDLAIDWLYGLGYLDWLIAATTISAAWLMAAIGIGLKTAGDQIVLRHETFTVTLECTAIYLAAMYSALVLAYPADLKRKLIGLAAGVPAILAVNILRLLFIAVVSELTPRLLPYVHDYLWQVAFVLLVTGLWLTWTRRDPQHEIEAVVRP